MDDKLRMIRFLGQYLAASRSEAQILEMAMIISQYVLGYDHAIIRVLDDDKLTSRKWIGFPREAADLNIGLGEGVCGRVAKSGRTILVEDTLQEPMVLKGVENCRSELCAPLVYNEKVVGVFNVESDKSGFFTERDIGLLETLATQVAAAMETTRLREELSRTEKLSVVGAMASSILHDIRSDIHTLYVSSDLLRNPEIKPERIEKLADTVKSAGENIYGLIEEILEFVRTGKSRISMKRVELLPVLESVVEQARSFAPDNVSVELSAGKNVALEMDRGRFKRMVLNLLRNAVEAMPAGGVVRVVCRQDNDEGVIEVADTGVGIDESQLEKIWEPLYTHGKKAGVGLGMAIVRKIVEEHGWTISVWSVVGQGTTFTIKTG
ncbi:hypothetical protein MNBD_NITROSPINAE01-1188 [hydrothermal vent metagenome]|uniref:histidine kinase n=1 Tax=hydrothermal vent metagenome TaxID=652676 RepID=A0A3B1C7Y5_9ZZZZ